MAALELTAMAPDHRGSEAMTPSAMAAEHMSASRRFHFAAYSRACAGQQKDVIAAATVLRSADLTLRWCWPIQTMHDAAPHRSSFALPQHPSPRCSSLVACGVEFFSPEDKIIHKELDTRRHCCVSERDVHLTHLNKTARDGKYYSKCFTIYLTVCLLSFC